MNMKISAIAVLLGGLSAAGAASATPLLEADGTAAQKTYEALDVEGQHDGAYRTTKTATGTLRCTKREPWNGPVSYFCRLGEALDVDGSTAKQLYGAYQVEGRFDGAYHTFKRAHGQLTCTALTPWGAPSRYDCQFERQ